MNDLDSNTEKIKMYPMKNVVLLKNIINNLKEIFHGKRRIMYSDIINIIIRENYKGEGYNQLILWCNYKIRLGETFVKI